MSQLNDENEASDNEEDECEAGESTHSQMPTTIIHEGALGPRTSNAILPQTPSTCELKDDDHSPASLSRHCRVGQGADTYAASTSLTSSPAMAGDSNQDGDDFDDGKSTVSDDESD